MLVWQGKESGVPQPDMDCLYGRVVVSLYVSDGDPTNDAADALADKRICDAIETAIEANVPEGWVANIDT